jgi:hypothetical protein
MHDEECEDRGKNNDAPRRESGKFNIPGREF